MGTIIYEAFNLITSLTIIALVAFMCLAFGG